MIIRTITYHALPGKDVELWMQTSASELRGLKGMRQVEFIRSQSDPSQYGAIMHFRNMTDLDNYKENEKWSKNQIVKLFFKILPDFAHKETGKYLDGKM